MSLYSYAKVKSVSKCSHQLLYSAYQKDSYTFYVTPKIYNDKLICVLNP